ncbi:hypothetical protein ACQPWY_25685 [Pseudonocardia xinjiangensis]|uniref:hypothetical protein n=1 Tax=Pseudonocardia xinjiangensis TaxID=75289 RepID=UPI003D94EFD5
MHDYIADVAKLRKVLRSVWRRPSVKGADNFLTVGEVAAVRFAANGVPAKQGEAGEDRHTAKPGPSERSGKSAQPDESRRLSLDAIPIGTDNDAPRSIKDRHFCANCMPIGTALDPVVMIAAVVAGVGVLIIPSSTVIGLALIGLSVFRILVRLWRGWRRRKGDLATQELFLDPRITKLATVETLKGRCALDENRDYMSEVKEVAGRIEVEAIWSRTNNADAQKHRKQVALGAQESLRAVAGTLIVSGGGQRTLRSTEDVVVTHPSAIRLRPRVEEHSVLSTPDGRGDPRWRFSVDYELAEPDQGWKMPVWLTPSFAPDSDRRALELRVQWRTEELGEDMRDDEMLLAKELTSVVVLVPGEWGEVTQVEMAEAEQCTVGSIDRRGRRRIEWRKPNVATAARGMCRLAVSFDRRIDVGSRIAGEVQMRFDRTLSGVASVDVHAAGGARRHQRIHRVTRTDVSLSFNLSLAAVRYQAIRSVPDRAKDKDFREQNFYPGIVPDHQCVAELVEQLSNDGYYVKSVVENPPRPGSSARVVNRVWDISGRRYHRLHPTDFRIIMTGEEPESGSDVAGSATVRVTVKGAYASTEMERRILREHEQLWKRIDTTLRAMRKGADGVSLRAPGEPADIESARSAVMTNVLLSVQEMVAEAEREGAMPTTVARSIIDRIDDELGHEG